MAYSTSRLSCVFSDGYGSVHRYSSDGSDLGSAIGAAGFFNASAAELKIGDIILAGVTLVGAGGYGVSAFVVTHKHSAGVSVNGV